MESFKDIQPTGEATPPFTRSPSEQSQTPPESTMSPRQDSTLRLKTLRSGIALLLDGKDLAIVDLVAVARYGVRVQIDDNPFLKSHVERSVGVLATKLRVGQLVYGVNTGFGGSADTRTSNLTSLQRALVQHQNSGILSRADLVQNVSDLEGISTSMPTSWVRGLMLSRVNSLLRGHSAVSIPVINAILALINHSLTPIIPLRGSISASGDLQPLSYIAGVLQGNPCMRVRTGHIHGNRIVTAPEALEIVGLQPIVLAAKEGLGLLNGTAASVAVASLALYDTKNLAMLAQVLTAMAVEALAGTAESFDPFISVARPHQGQERAAATILGFLQGSKLAHGLVASHLDHERTGLCQDRYALRTSPQWIGPLLEDLELAMKQICTELNSTTDNPLIDTSRSGTVHHGGNFQAASVTSATEKTRNALQQLGKMLFAQSTEINNPSMNRGLPPNLCADDPSTSFTCKGIDINMAAYASELGWLNHPVGPHVQSAEMHNQAINSLALLSGRATKQATEVLSSMCAAYLFMVCQALDLRVLLIRFFVSIQREFTEAANDFLKKFGASEEDIKQTVASLWTALLETWNSTTTMDLADRCIKTAEIMTGQLIHRVSVMPDASLTSQDVSLKTINNYRQTLSTQLHTTYISLRSQLFANYMDLTPTYLGRASSTIYAFVRKDLGVPFFRGLMEDPTNASAASFEAVEEKLGRERKTIGCWISIIYESLRDDTLFEKLAELA